MFPDDESNIDDKLKSETVDQNSQESSSQDTQASSEKAIAETEKDDDVGQPNFESAPNISIDEQEDHSEVIL